MTTILLTGFGRSGTTLMCVLLQGLENSVALVEPKLPPAKTPAQMLSAIQRFDRRVRHLALTEGVVPTKGLAGKLVDNVVPEPAAVEGLRATRVRPTRMAVGKPLTTDFRLYIKHPAYFTASAAALQSRYALYPIIRDPLAVLASWQTVNMPVQDGHMYSAEQLDPPLRRRLAAIPDRLDRQVELIRWALEIYSTVPAERIVRYEDLVSAPEATLARLHPNPGRIDHPLWNEPVGARYPQVSLDPLAGALARLTPLIRNFYPEWEAERALAEARG